MPGKNSKKRRTNSALYVTITLVPMLIAVFAGLSVFFKVSEFRVEGETMYTEAEIIRAAEIREDSSIFFINESAATARIKKALPYVNKVQISRVLPGTVKIEIIESYPIASVESNGSLWVIDKDAKVLEKLALGSRSDAIVLRGIAPIMPAVGDNLALGDAGTVQYTYLCQVLEGFMESGIYGEVQWLDMTSISSITFSYQNRLVVNLGKGDDVADKLWLLRQIATDHPYPETGTVDVSNGLEGVFRPG